MGFNVQVKTMYLYNAFSSAMLKDIEVLVYIKDIKVLVERMLLRARA
jgi:hypothetical protein